MKNTINTTALKIVATLTSILLLISLLSVSVFAATAPTPATGDIVINNAKAGDKFSAYKVINITYNSGSNTLSYDWTDEVKTAMSAKEITAPTIEEFSAFTESKRQELLAKIAAAITTSSPAKSGITVAESGEATFDNLAWGEYLIVPTLTTSVYQIMLGAVQPVGNGSGWTVTQGEKLGAKKSDGPTVVKEANDDNVGLWSVITYTIDFSVPKYDDTCVDKKTTLKDTASSALVYKENLKIYGVKSGSTDTELTVGDVTVSANTSIPALDTAGFTITFDFDYDKISTYDSIKVTYDAQINDSAALKTNTNTNLAEFEYSNYPYVVNNHKTITSSEEVYTYGIKIFKYDGNSTTKTAYDEVTTDAAVKPLPGAKFDVYRSIEDGETGESVNGITGNVVKVDTITSGDDGYASIKDLKAGTYYLVETQAPSGYNLLSAPMTVTISKDQTDSQGYLDTLVANNSGFNLPQTGGMGTLIFTVSGILLMVCAVILLVVLKKRKAKSAE